MPTGDLNKIIHEQTKLKILVLLSSNIEGEVSFTYIKNELQLTAGNVSIQLKTLEEVGYIVTEKTISGNKVRTCAHITALGKKSLLEYLEAIENLLSTVKKTAKGEG